MLRLRVPTFTQSTQWKTRCAGLTARGLVTPPAVTLLLHTSMASATGGYGSPYGKSRRRRRRGKKKHYYGHKGGKKW